MTTITALPTAPSRTDPSTFSARADALLGALDQFVTETNAVAGEVNANATIATTQVALATTQVALATTQATNAANSATASAQSALVAGAVAWVSGTTYAIGNARYSPANGQTYRRLTAGAGTTDPSADTTNWVIVNGITSEAILLTTNNLPTVRPTLNLDFANSKIVDPRITFTRASTATMVNANGLIETVASGAPRIDYDPVTLACKGLLVEESRTNLLTYSEQFDNAAWVKSNTSISANAATAPDGTVTADKLAENAANSIHFLYQHYVKAASPVTYSVSIYAKAAGRSSFTFGIYGGSSGRSTADFDLYAGTVSSTINTSGFTSSSASIQLVAEGFYRCTVTATTNSDASVDIQLTLLSSGNSTYTGDGTSGIYLFGAQLEAGAFATSYVSTTSAQVTRAADIATMTGGNFSSWYRRDEFTSVVRFIANAVGTQVYAKWNDTTANEEIKLESVSGTLTLTVTDGGVAQAAIALGSVVTGTTYTVAATWKVNDIAASINGGAVVTDTAATLPTPTQRVIGSSVTVRGYPKRLANATLVALSTP